MADDPDMREFYDTLLTFQSKAMENSTGYNQVIILAGYATFFAVWSTVADEIPKWVTLSSGALIMVSVIVYVGWTVSNMIFLKSHDERMTAELTKGFEDFYPRLAAVEAETLRRSQKIMKWWLPVVIAAGGTALIAAGLLSGAAVIRTVEGAGQLSYQDIELRIEQAGEPGVDQPLRGPLPGARTDLGPSQRPPQVSDD